jgi:hypothetical protein
MDRAAADAPRRKAACARGSRSVDGRCSGSGLANLGVTRGQLWARRPRGDSVGIRAARASCFGADLLCSRIRSLLLRQAASRGLACGLAVSHLRPVASAGDISRSRMFTASVLQAALHVYRFGLAGGFAVSRSGGIEVSHVYRFGLAGGLAVSRPCFGRRSCGLASRACCFGRRGEGDGAVDAAKRCITSVCASRTDYTVSISSTRVKV